ncbi:phosphatase PAP2 family protein [Zooshikella harenae]|uniref:Phosphatase PAP2 family protein n=1 Tax=Zooshikella harenae TaxID=2827238 RepID=A0ABS5ZEB8_9GAMM|nr:phosphatase PAP2 family protein [Zooshikella harenae]MBU2712315.1 phosphatase PAP2 family protein [Zooshikella harenae]
MLLFEWTSLDIWVQHYFFNIEQQQWLWDKSEPIAQFVLYDGIKVLLIVLALFLIICLTCFRHIHWVKERLHGFRIVLLSLILVPLTISTLKATTNVACPHDLQVFGGQIPYIKVLETYPENERPLKQQRCFPAGHASGGFALLSLTFLFQSKRNKQRALIFALCLGWVMGGYKMIIGDHFLSHTLVTMEVSWLLICFIVLINQWIQAINAKLSRNVSKTFLQPGESPP